MGARFGAECFADGRSAAEAQCASVGGVTSAGFMSCTGVTGGNGFPLSLNLQTVAPGGAVTTATLAFAVDECDPFEGYADLAEMWAIALPAILAVVLVREFITRHVMPQ